MAAAVTAVIALLALWIGALAAVLGAQGRAGTAADAAALAAAPVTFLPFGASGTAEEEAARFASLNGAELAWCTCPPDPSFDPRTVEVGVVVEVDLPVIGGAQVTGVGRAEFVPALLLDSRS